MLLTKTVKVKWHGQNRKWYEDKGYKYTKRGDEFKCSPIAIIPTNQHSYKIKVKCDKCDSDEIIITTISKYLNNLKRNNGIYLCNTCEKHKEYDKYIGQKVGRLTIVKYLGYYNNSRKDKEHWFECKCDCGNICIKTYKYLFHNNIKIISCGCWNTERTIQFNKNTKTNFDNDYYTKNKDYYIIAYRNNKKYETIVDKNMFDYLKKKSRKLSIDCRGYAFISQEDTQKQMFIHNLVIFGEDYYNKNMNILVDHINSVHIRDNRKSNLRLANDYQNSCNRKRNSNNTTGIKGITIRKPKNQNIPQIIVRISKNYKRIRKIFPFNLKGLKDAILWDLEKRKELHGEFTNYGFDIKDKTTEEIIKEQSEVFINNLNDNYKHILYK